MTHHQSSQARVNRAAHYVAFCKVLINAWVSGVVDVAQGILKMLTKDIFKAEVHAWAGRIGVEVKALHLRRMTRKWGSCSTAGRLTFNAELLGESAEVRKKVIVHELWHLKVPNHGKVLRALLRTYLSRDETTVLSNHAP